MDQTGARREVKGPLRRLQPRLAPGVIQQEGMSLLMLLLAILIPACASSSLSFHMMCSAYKLNKQG